MITALFSIILLRMPLVQEKITSRYSITGYSANSVAINEKDYCESLILSATTIISPWPVYSVETLELADLVSVLDMNPDVVLLGTGVHQKFPSAQLYAMFGSRGIGLEVMNNGALCRTFNILVAEDREVVAAIILE